MVWGHRRSQLLEASVNFLCSDTWCSQKSDCPCSSVGVNFVDISRSPLLLIVDFLMKTLCSWPRNFDVSLADLWIDFILLVDRISNFFTAFI
jgi:hypothetical protein